MDLPRLILALRPDLSERFRFDLHEHHQAYLAWLITNGVKEYQALKEEPSFLDTLLRPGDELGVDAHPGLTRLQALVRFSRPDVQSAFPLPSHLRAFQQWFACHGVGEHHLWPFLSPAEKNAVLTIAQHCSSPHLSQLKAWVLADQAECSQLLHPQSKPFGVNLIGYAHGQLGIGEDLRMTAKALALAKVPFAVVNFAPGPDVAQNDRSMTRHVVDVGPYAINVFCMTAWETARFYAERGKHQFQGRYNIGYWPWELSQWPAEWTVAFELVDEVWVSSTHIRDALLSAKQPAFVKPVHVMPLVVEVGSALNRLRNPDVKRAVRLKHKLPMAAKLFCFAFDLNSAIHRKNPQAVVKAFQQAFPMELFSKRQVGLVVKVQVPKRVNKAWDALKSWASEDPRICIVEGTLSRTEVLSLYAACDCFVSLHRAEGFGRGLAEALQLGLQLIVTDHSGNIDFCRRQEFSQQVHLIPWRWIQVLPGQYPYAEGQRWANPSVSAAAKAMRAAVERKTPSIKVPRGGWPCFSAIALGLQYKHRLMSIQAQCFP